MSRPFHHELESRIAPARVLIAHQSSIPHYRVPFYAALEKVRGPGWSFDVVFDHSEFATPQFFSEPLAREALTFPLRDTRTRTLRVGGRRVAYQGFWRAAAGYDVVIVEHAINNLTYPLCQLHQLRGTKVALWGTGRDMGSDSRAVAKRAAESAKLALARAASGFFAYTEGVRTFLLDHGLRPDHVWALGNTIDIEAQRDMFEEVRGEREAIRAELGLSGRKVLLFVGRFTKGKRVDLLLDSFARLVRDDPSCRLLLVGAGAEDVLRAGVPLGVSHHGVLLERELARIYCAADVLAFPGSVGLGPLQALCYDLPALVIDGDTHKPEFEYLSGENAVVLPRGTDAAGYARALAHLLSHPSELDRLRAGAWPSIRHLTIGRMAGNFAAGVERLLT